MATKYDAIVIGTGQAGPSLAVRLADAGMTVAIVATALPHLGVVPAQAGTHNAWSLDGAR